MTERGSSHKGPKDTSQRLPLNEGKKLWDKSARSRGEGSVDPGGEEPDGWRGTCRQGTERTGTKAEW